MSNSSLGVVRHDWTKQEVQALFDLPFNDLLFQAQSVHRQNFDPNEVQVSTLLSIKTGPALRIVNIALKVVITTPASRKKN